MNKKEISRRVTNILNEKKEEKSLNELLEKYSHINNNDWEEDLKIISGLSDGPNVHRKSILDTLENFNIDEVNKIINNVANEISKQREIDRIEMNKDMFFEMMNTHNHGQFFNNLTSIEIKIDDRIEDKVIKVKYRR